MTLASTFFFIVIAHVLLLLWQLKVSIYLQWEKWKSAFISVLLQLFWQKFYWNVSGVLLYQPYEFCSNYWFWLVAMATESLKFWKKKTFKIFLLRSHIAFIAVHSGERCGRWASGFMCPRFQISRYITKLLLHLVMFLLDEHFLSSWLRTPMKVNWSCDVVI